MENFISSDPELEAALEYLTKTIREAIEKSQEVRNACEGLIAALDGEK